MTTTDPTITIAGLRAQVDSLETSLRAALDDGATSEEVRLIREAERAAVAAERDALAAQLAEARAQLAAAPKVCAIHSYEHGPGPCMTCGAWPPGTRELIAACQARIAGLEQAADERSRTGQMSEPERSEWHGIAIAIADALGGSLGPIAGTPREWVHFAAGLADRAKKLTARVAELEARPVLTEERMADGPTVAPPEVFAGVTVEELARVFWSACGVTTPIGFGPDDIAGIRAVLARLKVATIAPVDPEQLAADITSPIGDAVRTGEWKRIKEAARDGLIARGIPVTPERGQ